MISFALDLLLVCAVVHTVTFLELANVLADTLMSTAGLSSVAPLDVL